MWLNFSTPANQTLPDDFILEAGTHTIENLLERAAKFLNRNFLWNEAETGEGKITLQNRRVFDARGCEAAVGQFLYARGFVLVPLDVDQGTWEVVNMQGSRRAEIATRPISMDPERVISRREMYYMVRCVVP